MIYGGLNRLSEHLEASLTLCVCEIDPLNFYNPPRRFAEDKTDSPHFYTSPTRFAVVQTHFRCSSYTLYGSPNPLPNLLQASYTLCGCQNELLQPPTHFTGVKTDSPNFLKPSTCFGEVKTDSHNTYIQP